MNAMAHFVGSLSDGALLAQVSGSGASTLQQIVAIFPWWAWVAILAIVSSAAIAITRMVIGHRERMEYLRQGMQPPPEYPTG
jgi:hypothetical protein